MDVPSRQVMIEVTIATVLLTDEINFGVEWLFKGGAPSGRGSGGNLTRSTPRNPDHRRRHGRHRAFACQGLRLHHQQRELPGRRPGGAASAGHLRRHEGHRQPASRRARQSEGDDQVGRENSDQPAKHRRQHDERGHHDIAIHRHRRAAAGHPAHQLRRTGHAGSAGGSQRSRQLRPRRGAADQHAVGANGRRCPVRTDDGDGRPHRRDEAEQLRRVSRCSRAFRSSADSSAIRRSRTTAPSS